LGNKTHLFFSGFCFDKHINTIITLVVLAQPKATDEDRYEKDVFLIYAGKDEETVKKIYDGLKGQRMRCAAQFDTETFPAGKPIIESISKLILQSHRTVLVLSQNALESSWISLEVILALEQSQHRKNEDLTLRLLLVDTDESQAAALKIGHLAQIPHICLNKDDNDWKSLKDKLRGIDFSLFAVLIGVLLFC